MPTDWPTIEPSEPSIYEEGSAKTNEEVHRDRENRPKGLPGTTAEVDINDKPLVLMGLPPVIEEYNVGELYDDDINDLQNKISIIDAYLKNYILNKNWKPLFGSYKKAITELETYLSLDDDMTSLDKIDREYYYLKGKMKL